MKNNIALTQERLVQLFEEGVHFGVHNAGDFGDMHKAFANKLEELVVQQMEEGYEGADAGACNSK